ncbi:uncharacterized protein N7473_003759 [Penicillium subrubescens]|uniref:uncharacterized protein n=1 Tax=Penicillium subrubescens TaxID=1316194 RepID=UPI002545259B|nr:uncharacterized protein N7473_003759 [Penicillium subrubescens]KAJ5906843.1 hypothetical protein N7473_003759 [Penicillium subrubescens]
MTDNRTCYYPDGTEAKNLVPCTAKTTTACCGVNNICLSNGYCLDVNQPFSLARGGCTAQKWGTGCPGRCRTVNSNEGSAIVTLQTINGSSRYCCGTPVANGSDTVCRDDTDSFLLADAQVLTGRAALANLVTPDSSLSSNSSNSSIPAPASTSNSHDTTIGVGLGVPLGVIAIGSILWALWERRRANKLSRAMIASSIPVQEGLVRSPQSHVMSERSSVPTELDSNRTIPELMPREQM